MKYIYTITQIRHDTTGAVIKIMKHEIPIMRVRHNQYLASNQLFVASLQSRDTYENVVHVSMLCQYYVIHYSDVIIGALASQITGVSIVYSSFCSGADQRKHQSSASVAFVRGIHWWPVNYPHKGPATRKMFPFDDVSCIQPFIKEIFL